jgi:Protein of unknown function (DUF3140)
MAGVAGGRAFPPTTPEYVPTVDDDERRWIRHDFGEAVTMTAAEMKRWLRTDESQSVGDSDGGNGESTGHEMGRHIVELLDRKAADLSDEDLKRMRKVVGYVHRHLAQRPSGDVTDTKWRYSLMNWGHNPVK